MKIIVALCFLSGWLVIGTQGATILYDSLGRISRIDNSDGSAIEYSYDTNGNQTNRTVSKSVELTITVEPPNSGVATGAGRFRPNTVSRLAATPASEFDFVAWLDAGGTVLSTESTYDHTITTAENVIARFIHKPAPEVVIEDPTTSPPTGLETGIASISFGARLLQSLSAKVLTIRNVGNGPLSNLSAQMVGQEAADFAILDLPGSLSPGTAGTIVIQFSPSGVGSRLTTLSIASNDADESPFDITLTGIGTALEHPAGSLDVLDASVVGSFAAATAEQPDGKLIIAGKFTSVLGVPRSNVARLNADGSLDMGFDPKANSEVWNVMVQPDGGILLGGIFTALQPNGSASATTRNRIARLNADGSLDIAFDPKADEGIYGMAVQPDGRILLGGWFSTLQPNGSASATTRNRIARLNADGSLDMGFDPKPNNGVASVAVQTNGKILLGGGFTTLQPNGAVSAITRNRIARVNADGSLDADFDPRANNVVWCVAVQPDDKILLGGKFSTLQPNSAVSAITRNRIARLNADGSLDADFDPNANDEVDSVTVQADGKILLAGAFTTLQPNGSATATTRNRIARLNADGSLDMGFDPKANSDVYSVAVQANGKVVLGGTFTSLQPNGAATATDRNLFAWLNNDAAPQTLSAPDATQVHWLRGGSSPELSWVTFEQSLDGGANWIALDNGIRVGTTANWQLNNLGLPANGYLRARGRTSGGNNSNSSGIVEALVPFNGLSTPEIVVEQPVGVDVPDGGSRDFGGINAGAGSSLVFTVKNVGTADLTGLLITKDGTDQEMFTVTTNSAASVSSSNGSTTFTVQFTPTTAGAKTATLHIASNDADENPFDITLTGTGTGFEQMPGSLDALNASLSGNFVAATAVQPDGKLIIAGKFASVLEVPRSNIARFNADGSLDTGFDPKVNGEVWNVVVQPDGRILLGGTFTALQPNGAANVTARNRIARVNADGSIDTAFDPKADDDVYGVAVQTDGKIVLGGWFSTLQPNGAATATTRRRIARLNADGSLDMGFDPKPNNGVASVAVQTDGRILLGGGFTTLQPNGSANATARSRIARVNPDGSLDTDFDPKADNVVWCVAVQPDGKILLGGKFSTLQPNGAVSATTRNRIVRVNTNGTLDTEFDPNANDEVDSITVQADGKILFGGAFTTLRPNGASSATSRHRIARVNPDGSVDNTFDPKADNDVYSVALQANGKILLGGLFTTLQPNGAVTPTERNLFASLNNDAANQTLLAPDATQVHWLRGGSSPELSWVTFEQSLDGGANWTMLGNGTRVGTTANWQLAGLILPAGGHVRARGRTTGGNNSNSSGFVEAVSIFGISSDADLWRLSFFGTEINSGPSADASDPDRDGVNNLQERAFNMNPTVADNDQMRTGNGTTGLPVATLIGAPEDLQWKIEFLRRRTDPRLTYTVELSSTLLNDAPDGWEPATASPTITPLNAQWERVTVQEPIDTHLRRFVRVKVTQIP